MRKLAISMMFALIAAPLALAQDSGDDGTTWVQDYRASHPNVSDQELRQITEIHRQNPDLDKDQVRSMSDFRKQNPDVASDDARDMWEFHKNNPGISRDEMKAAYKDYQGDRDGFRQRNDIPGGQGLTQEEATKVEHLRKQYPDATEEELTAHARKMDDKETKQARTQKNADRAAGGVDGDRPDTADGTPSGQGLTQEEATKVEHLRKQYPDATEEELTAHARKMDDKETKQARTQKNADRAAKKGDGDRPDKADRADKGHHGQKHKKGNKANKPKKGGQGGGGN